MDLLAETDSRRFTDLAQELSRVLAIEGLGGPPPTRGVQANPYLRFRTSGWVPDLLASAIQASEADFGTLQLLDSSSQVLRITAHQGFKEDFLSCFETVSSSHGCACGFAMRHGTRVFVPDVASDPLFQASSREVLLRAGVCSVQSTPLLSASGDFIGIVSTHYRRPTSLSSLEWGCLDGVVAGYMAKVKVPGYC